MPRSNINLIHCNLSMYQHNKHGVSRYCMRVSPLVGACWFAEADLLSQQGEVRLMTCQAQHHLQQRETCTTFIFILPEVNTDYIRQALRFTT